MVYHRVCMLDDLLIFLHIVYLTYWKTFSPFFSICYWELNFNFLTSANRNPSVFLSHHEWVNCDIHFMCVVLFGCSREKFVCVTVSHYRRVYLLFWKGYTVSSCAMVRTCAVLLQWHHQDLWWQVLSLGEMNCIPNDLNLRENWEDWVVGWRDIIKIDLKCCDWSSDFSIQWPTVEQWK